MAVTYALFLFSTFVSTSVSVVVNNYEQHYNNNDSTTIWEQCWIPASDFMDIPSAGSSWAGCVKHKMYTGLIENLERPVVDIGDGVTFISDGEAHGLSPREIFPLGEEPSSFRVLVDAYSTFLSRRGIRWDLSHMYPGLIMRIGPTINGDGVLEFIMDRRLDYTDRAKLGPGQQMIRRTILPHLLGFRMNLFAILPILFGILVYVAKNAFIFSKITLVVSTLLTLKSLFLLQHLRTPHHLNHGVANDYIDSSASSDSGMGLIGGPRPKPHSAENLVLQMFTNAVPPFRGVNKFPDDTDSYRKSGKRGFAWER